MDDDASRNADAETLGHFAQRLLEQGWRLFVEAAPEHRGEFDWDTALAALKERTDAAFAQFSEQCRSVELPIESLFGLYSQFSSLAQQPLLEPLALWRPWLDALGSMPALGPLQHKQQQLEAASRALAQLRESQQDYLALLREITDGAIDELRARLGGADGELSSREFYELWLAAGETAYERVLTSERYAQAMGRLSNHSSHAMQQLQGMFEDVLGSLNLPTRAELQSTQKRLHEMRRRQRATRQESRELATLRAELDALREEVAALKAATAGAEPRRRRRSRRAG